MGYQVVRANLEQDREAVEHFWYVHHKYELQFKYQHFYLDNPAGKARLWLLKKDTSPVILGMIALFPRKVSVNAKTYNAGVIGDIFVDPHHRALGPALMLLKSITRYVDRKKVDFVYTFPNQNADIVTRRVGFSCLGDVDRFVKVIDYQPYLRKTGFPSGVSRSLALVFKYVNNFFSFLQSPGNGDDVICKRVMQVDSDFDELWEKVKNDFSIIGDRSSEYLQWRMLVKSGVIFAVYTRKNNRLLGYAACTIDERFLTIRDLVLPPQSGGMIQLFMTITRHAYKVAAQGINIHLLINDQVEDILKRHGYHKRKHNRKVYFYGGNFEETDRFLLENYKNWFLISGDSDSMGTSAFTAE